jgi:hypothetical protein
VNGTSANPATASGTTANAAIAGGTTANPATASGTTANAATASGSTPSAGTTGAWTATVGASPNAATASAATAPVGGAPVGGFPCAGTRIARWHFEVGSELASLKTITLRIRYTHGFAAYLNGVEIARRRLDPGAPPDGLATDVHGPEAERFIVVARPGLLRRGDNVLAVEVHPRTAGREAAMDLTLGADDGARIIRGPYLLRVQEREVTVVVDTDLPTSAEIRYGRTDGYGARVSDGLGIHHVLRITGLRAATVYHYRVRVRSASSATVPAPDARDPEFMVQLHNNDHVASSATVTSSRATIATNARSPTPSTATLRRAAAGIGRARPSASARETSANPASSSTTDRLLAASVNTHALATTNDQRPNNAAPANLASVARATNHLVRANQRPTISPVELIDANENLGVELASANENVGSVSEVATVNENSSSLSEVASANENLCAEGASANENLRAEIASANENLGAEVASANENVGSVSEVASANENLGAEGASANENLGAELARANDDQRFASAAPLANAGDKLDAASGAQRFVRTQKARRLLLAQASPPALPSTSTAQSLARADAVAAAFADDASPADSGDAVFHTIPEAGRPLRFAVYGDVRSGHDIHAALVKALSDEDPDFAILTGDLVDRGSDEGDWERFFEIAAPLLRQLPIFPAIGNHEYMRQGHGVVAFMQLFRWPVAADELPAWYSFDAGAAHFVALDSNQYKSPRQLAWLDHDLDEAHRRGARAIFVYAHEGPFSSGLHGDNAICIRDYVPLMERHHVSMFFGGHDHDYERGRVDALDYVVTGGGGAELRAPRCGIPGRRPCPPRVASFVNDHNYVMVELLPSLFRVCPKRVDGSPLESCTVYPLRR